ncbi:hypothetical protein C8R47DRAFT_1196087 [Mycena vitilis]|nr:hypothetical protein C8R47DRAFT_1196087 [Mycena vitilis]
MSAPTNDLLKGIAPHLFPNHTHPRRHNHPSRRRDENLRLKLKQLESLLEADLQQLKAFKADLRAIQNRNRINGLVLVVLIASAAYLILSKR